MVDPVSIVSAVDLCFKYGTRLVHLCSAFAHANSEIKDRLLRVRMSWMQAELQIKVVRSIAEELNEDQREIQYETLETLATKLKIAAEIIESITKSQSRRLKYMLLHKKVDKAIEDLTEWQQAFNPIWYSMMTRTNSQIDANLAKYKESSEGDFRNPVSSAQSLRSALNPEKTEKVRLPDSFLENLELQDIPLCSAQIGKRRDTGKSVIVERMEPPPGTNLKDLERDVRDLSKRLIRSDALEFGLMSCKGFMKHRKQYSNREEGVVFTIVFRVPAGFSHARTLRRCLMDIHKTESLSDRVKLANGLARAVSYVHTFGFVHKNIRPETILLLGENESSIGSVFLIGFDSFRMASGKTLRKGEAAWEKCLYQHPSRIGPAATEDYIMQHDIYSLGVCLLEVGLWESLVEYDNHEAALSDDGSGTPPTRASILGENHRSVLLQERLISLAKGELRTRMGTKYSQVVVTCLTCLDPGNVDFGDETEFEDEDGIEVGVRYIQRVTMRLNSIGI